MSTFKRVLMAVGQPEIAKVNMKTGTLYLSSVIWDRLPQPEKDYVLLHEEGHLKLQTTDEYKANAYAVGKFLKAGTFTNKQLGQKIMVMRSVLDKADGQTAGFSEDTRPSISGNDIYGIGAGLGAIFQGLPILGIGSKARIKETKATAEANAPNYSAQAKAAASKSKSIQTIVLIAGVLVIVAVAIYFTLRKKS